MLLHDALLSRRTIYKNDGRAVPGDVLDRALEAARWAPNHKMTQPWRFVVAGPETRAQIAEVNAALAIAKVTEDDDVLKAKMAEKARGKIMNAGGLVVALQALTPPCTPGAQTAAELFREKEDYAAVCCAVHNFVLSLWADGVGCVWGTGGLTRDARALAHLGVNTDTHNVVGFLRIGYPAAVPSPTRKPLTDVVRHLP